MKEALFIVAAIAVLAGFFALQMVACFNCVESVNAGELVALLD